ncbi:hypothetical protein ABFA07_007773 [Porites harrisoni]
MFIALWKSNVLSDTVVPVGHLKPLGSHRPPQTNLVDDLEEMPSPQDFWRKYVLPSRAVVLRGAAKHAKAFTKWTDKYIKEKYADLEIRLEGKKEKSSKVPVGAKGVGRDTIGNFINNYHEEGNNLYVVSELPTPMWQDVTVIPPLTCGLLKDRLVEVDLWMSGGGTKSILHKDAYNAINCLYNGTKEWKMIEYKYEDKIYKAWEPPQMVGGYSRLNVHAVDLLKYPKVSEVPWSFVTVHAGDCLFLPKSYYHQVTSYGSQNTAVALLFGRLDGVTDIDFTGCDQLLSFKPLNEMDVDWKYSGHGNLSMGNTDVETVREGMLEFFADEEKLDKDRFLRRSEKKIKKKMLYSYLYRVQEQALLMFDLLGGNKKGFVTKDDVRRLNRDEMRAIVLAIEGTDVSNTEEAEYGVVDPGEIRSILQNLVVRDGQIFKDDWIEAYMEETGGTKHFAEMFFSKLRDDTSISDKVTKEEIQRNIDRALQRYMNWQQEPEIPPGQDSPEPQDAYREDDEDREEDEQEDDEEMEATVETKHEEL